MERGRFRYSYWTELEWFLYYRGVRGFSKESISEWQGGLVHFPEETRRKWNIYAGWRWQRMSEHEWVRWHQIAGWNDSECGAWLYHHGQLSPTPIVLLVDETPILGEADVQVSIFRLGGEEIRLEVPKMITGIDFIARAREASLTEVYQHSVLIDIDGSGVSTHEHLINSSSRGICESGEKWTELVGWPTLPLKDTPEGIRRHFSITIVDSSLYAVSTGGLEQRLWPNKEAEMTAYIMGSGRMSRISQTWIEASFDAADICAICLAGGLQPSIDSDGREQWVRSQRCEGCKQWVCPACRRDRHRTNNGACEFGLGNDAIFQ